MNIHEHLPPGAPTCAVDDMSKKMCSGHGECVSGSKCSCDGGWTGSSCETRCRRPGSNQDGLDACPTAAPIMRTDAPSTESKPVPTSAPAAPVTTAAPVAATTLTPVAESLPPSETTGIGRDLSSGGATPPPVVMPTPRPSAVRAHAWIGQRAHIHEPRYRSPLQL